MQTGSNEGHYLEAAMVMDPETPVTDNPGSLKRSKRPLLFGLLIPAIVVLPLWFFFLGPKLRQDRLEEHGVHVPGRLIDVEETGTIVNDSPQLKLVIEFKRLDGHLDTATTTFVPSLRSVHFFQSGAAVTAAYDSTDPHEITITDISTGPTTAPGIQTVPAPNTAAIQDSLRRTLDSMRELMQKMQEQLKSRKK
ncbi:MAG TPA: hypothetical protein VHI13_19815 [Candidatus Kapabacteria bacterium]|nr:hypothetical protein [Candidatus Kapabacteria bacterium]